jgi:hypothetical protein
MRFSSLTHQQHHLNLRIFQRGVLCVLMTERTENSSVISRIVTEVLINIQVNWDVTPFVWVSSYQTTWRHVTDDSNLQRFSSKLHCAVSICNGEAVYLLQNTKRTP